MDHPSHFGSRTRRAHRSTSAPMSMAVLAARSANGPAAGASVRKLPHFDTMQVRTRLTGLQHLLDHLLCLFRGRLPLVRNVVDHSYNVEFAPSVQARKRGAHESEAAPLSSASGASIIRELKMRSLARDAPTRRERRCVPPALEQKNKVSQPPTRNNKTCQRLTLE